MVESLLIGLFTNGHILVEGVPGVAKTTTIKTLARILDLEFKRVQFTPDLLPSDIIGSEIYNPKSGDFKIKKGAIFTQLLLADEINRSPSKVQSALLEAMQERQVTIGERSFKLEEPFLVMATQNPLEEEGVYSLPKAQLDRFMIKVIVKHNSRDEEIEIIKRATKIDLTQIKRVLSREDIFKISKEIEDIHIDSELEGYIVDLIRATREPNENLRYGAGTRASIDLYRASKAHSYIDRKSFVSPSNILAVAFRVLRHRIELSYEAKAKGLSCDEILKEIFDRVKIP
uniref:MoxR family ATPase n=1 Tax=Alvinella pompejana epibiont 6C6 TaxID=244799 RepID=Q6W3P5_9BACT|nr:MoxR family ATPase [Alvinella pompejana epibiont 6C6]